jgi:hypothetical protein
MEKHFGHAEKMSSAWRGEAYGIVSCERISMPWVSRRRQGPARSAEAVTAGAWAEADFEVIAADSARSDRNATSTGSRLDDP